MVVTNNKAEQLQKYAIIKHVNVLSFPLSFSKYLIGFLPFHFMTFLWHIQIASNASVVFWGYY
jgi:hypothetical protein